MECQTVSPVKRTDCEHTRPFHRYSHCQLSPTRFGGPGLPPPPTVLHSLERSLKAVFVVQSLMATARMVHFSFFLVVVCLGGLLLPGSWLLAPSQRPAKRLAGPDPGPLAETQGAEAQRSTSSTSTPTTRATQGTDAQRLAAAAAAQRATFSTSTRATDTRASVSEPTYTVDCPQINNIEIVRELG